MANNSVQVILNPENFVTARETNVGGSHKEFFPYKDEEFARHKTTLIRQVSSATEVIRTMPVDLGYAKVSLRRSALAKSNRPFDAVFDNEYTPIVGGLDLGQVLVRVTSSALERVAHEMNKSNPETRTRLNKKTNKPEFAPNVQRSETGAIEHFELYSASDRFQFSAEQAIRAFSDPRRGGTYYVELFELIPQRSDWDSLDSRLVRLFTSFDLGLRELGTGLEASRLDQTDARSPFISIRLLATANAPITPFAVAPGVAIRPADPEAEQSAVDLSPTRHARLLNFLRGHPLVRSVRIAPIFRRTAAIPMAARSMPATVSLPIPQDGKKYPIIGVIDGGIGACLSPWVVGKLGFLRLADRDEEHGTFISGLLVAGSALNGPQVCYEADGCSLIDMDMLPSESSGAFTKYFPAGSKDFFEALEDAILRCRLQYEVRVFNLSINADTQASLDFYSYEARKLDAIAQATDIIIVVSAGNVDTARPEWSPSPIQALSDLAVARDDTIQVPGETIRNISVSALNPPGVSHAIPDAPACYSRRGPGLRSGLKPDFSQYGGAKVDAPIASSGLYSVDPFGLVVEHQGTSFATPLVAKIVAALDEKIQGEVSRETLIALLAHYAEVRTPLDDPAFKDISRHLVGFGSPYASDRMLECADHEITLVFAARLMPDKMLRFPFSWPRSLVDASGKCRGRGRMTLVFSPPLNYYYGAEMVRVTLDAALQQEDPEEESWGGHAHQLYMQKRKRKQHPGEAELINDGLKWSTVKAYTLNMPKGVGKSSNWRIEVDYLTRNLTPMPSAGVPFTLLLTIEDPKAQETTVFNDLRQWLHTSGATISDIRTAARIAPRT
jgi:hypothetical protein